MRRFILTTISFILLSMLCIVGFWYLLATQRYIFCTTEATMLVCGNSTVEYGVDDSLLPNALNVGFNAEHPEFVYSKIKMIKEYSPSVDTVLIGVDDAFLSKNTDKDYHSDLHHFYYYDQMDCEDIDYMCKNTSLAWVESFIARPFNPIHIINLVKSAQKGEFRGLGIGGYYDLNGSNITNITEGAVTTPNNPDNTQYDSRLAEFYLRRIIGFCDKNDIKLIFFTTPKHSSGQTHGYRQLLDKSFPDIPLLDFTDYPLPDSCFYDVYHINKAGARAFTKVLADTINNI